MPLQLGQLLSEDPNQKKQQQQGLVGQAGALPGSPGAESGGLDFQGLFPTLTRTPISAPTAIRDTSGLMFNPEFAQRALGYDRQAADLQLGLNQGRQSVDQNYERSVADANRMQTAARRKLMERMSGQGILQSGIHGEKQGELGTEHQRYLDDLGYSRASNLNAVESQFAQMMNQIALQKENLFGEQQQVEEARRVEAARIQAQQAAAAEEARQQEAMLAAQRERDAASAAAQEALLRSISSQNYGGGGVSAPSYGGGAPAASAPAVWSNDDIYRTYQNAVRGSGGNYQGMMNNLQNFYNADPAWQQTAWNTAAQYGRGNDITSVLDFFTNPWNWGFTGAQRYSGDRRATA